MAVSKLAFNNLNTKDGYEPLFLLNSLINYSFHFSSPPPLIYKTQCAELNKNNNKNKNTSFDAAMSSLISHTASHTASQQKS